MNGLRIWIRVLVAVSLWAGLNACAARRTSSPPPAPDRITLRGKVVDTTEFAVPGVTVTAKHDWTGTQVETTTDAQGEYRLALPPGPVRLSASIIGFKTTNGAVMIEPNTVAEWNARLDIGSLSETLEVVVASPMVNTSAAMRGMVITSDGNVRRPSAPFNTEKYRHIAENDFLDVSASPLSTFSVDVDRASYANVRRFLNEGGLPPVDAVRIEELVNYFPYDYAPPEAGQPFAAHMEVVPAPWKPEHRLLRIGLKAREMPRDDRPASNLVFLIDVSGSMDEPNKLPLVQQALGLLVDQLDARDRVGIVVYAGAAGMVLAPTPGDQKAAIRRAIDALEAGGSTNGGEGIALAYDLAIQNLVAGGVNRVVLATDGDFNVGVSDEGSLVHLVQEKAKAGVFLSVLGFGMDNLQDSMLEALADKGDGNYAYIDTMQEARKAFVEELAGTLVTVAKDVKVQVEFNPAQVQSYRLIGYENRVLADEDFNDDRKDAGDVGAGHAVTVLYELVPTTAKPASARRVDPLVFSKPRALSAEARRGELVRLKLRYKRPEGGRSRRLEWPVDAAGTTMESASGDLKFAAAVAGFGMLLRQSPHAGSATSDMVLDLASQGLGADPHGYRAEFVELVRAASPRIAERAAEAQAHATADAR